MSTAVSYEHFLEQYSTEHACESELFRTRWPDGFRCPHCGHSHYFVTRTRRLPLYECATCRHQTSVIAGTIMEGSSTSLTKWFHAMYLLCQPAGISSLKLAKTIGVTYKTAWLIGHKIRHAIHQAEQADRLDGDVRLGMFEYGSLMFMDARQPLLIGGSFDESGTLQQVKIHQPHLDHVDEKARRATRRAAEEFIRTHTASPTVKVAKYYERIHPELAKVRIGLRPWLNRVFCGIGAKHLQAYVDEYCFRINQMKRSAFSSLLQCCSSTRVLIYKTLILPRPTLPVAWRKYGTKGKWISINRRAWGDF